MSSDNMTRCLAYPYGAVYPVKAGEWCERYMECARHYAITKSNPQGHPVSIRLCKTKDGFDAFMPIGEAE